MTPKERAVMQQALKALENNLPINYVENGLGEKFPCFSNDPLRESNTRAAIIALREALAGVNMSPTEQTNTQLMEGYRIGLAEMREKCAKVCDEYAADPDDDHNLSALCAKAIRAINFEGDTGFRPVSEMIAEHKQDPKKGAAIERAKMRKATRAEKIAMSGVYEVPVEQAEQEPVGEVKILRMYTDDSKFHYVDCQHLPEGTKLYTAPVRIKDLTDDDIKKLQHKIDWTAQWSYVNFARDVIAADREKNK